MTRSPARTWLPTYLAIAVLWGSTFSAIGGALGSFTPVGLVFLRMVVAAATMVVISAVARVRFPPRGLWLRIALMAAMAVVLPGSLLAFAQIHISSALAGILTSLVPLTTLLVVVLFYREERPTVPRVVGLFIGFLGMAVVVGVWNPLGTATLLGIVLVLASNVSYSSSIPFARRHLAGGERASTLSPIAITTAMYMFAAVETLPFAVVTGVQSAPFTVSSVASLVYLGLIGSAIAFVLNFRLIRISDVTTASTVMYLVPLVAITAGALFLGEVITWNEIVGAGVILVGAALAQGLIRTPGRVRRGDRALEADDVVPPPP